MQQADPSDSKANWNQRESVLLARYAMHSCDSQGREHPEHGHPYRGPFQRDRDRILHSSAFRRLSGKMQVFTGDMGDYHRTRLTHTHEVASLARTIGRTLRLNEDLVEAMALLHDIGHPPFGHCGEDVLSDCLKHHGGFSHNQFAMDLVTKIEQRYTDYPGLNLTHEVLSGQQFRSDKRNSETQMLEIQVVDAADSIAYDSHDVDDALKLGLLEWRQLDGLELVERAKRSVPLDSIEESLRRPLLVHTLLDLQMGDFLRHSSQLLEPVAGLTSQEVCRACIKLQMSPGIEQEKRQLERFLFENVYRHERLVEVRDKAAMRLRQLYKSLAGHPARLPDRARHWARSWGNERAVGAYLAGMTDRFCDEQYLLLVEMGRPCGVDWS
ncbi:MAG: dNTP triphosphohydrolase [Planctomycetota bacterium]